MKKQSIVLLLTAFLLTATLLLTFAGCDSGGGAAVTGSGWGEGEEAVDALESQDTPESLVGNQGGTVHNGRHDRELPDMTELTTIPSAASGNSLVIPDYWVTEHGAYYVEITQPDDSSVSRGMTRSESVGQGAVVYEGFGGAMDFVSTTLVKIIDSATGNDMVLCNRITCAHDSEDCGAYLPDDVYPDIDAEGGWAMTRTMRAGFGGNNPVLFIDGDYIYALNNGNTFYRLGLDGSGRVEHMTIPDKYEINSWGKSWLMNGMLYLDVTFMVQISEWSFSGVSALLEVDYINKTVNVIWESEVNQNDDGSGWSMNTMGLWNGQVFIMRQYYPPYDWNRENVNLLEYYAGQKFEIVSLNPANGQETIIFTETGDGFMSNHWSIDKDGTFQFHSRRDEALFSFNVVTGERKLLADGLPGHIFIYDERDGRILLMRDISVETGAEYDPYSSDSDMFFYDIAAGIVGKFTLKTKVHIDGEIRFAPMNVLFEEDGYYYFEVESVMEEQDGWGGQTWHSQVKVLLGRMPIDDFWNNNTSAIEELDWYEENDWWEMLAERRSW